MLRITPLIIHSKEAVIVPDCATGGDATSGGVLVGAIVDRLALGAAFTHAIPSFTGQYPGTTSTQGARYITLLTKMRHGDSSGGGDLADMSTGLIPDPMPFYTSQGESTDWKGWSTGLQRMQFSHKAYPLMGAKRFLAPAVIVQRIGATTATAAGNLVTGSLHLCLLNQDQEGAPDFSVAPEGRGNVVKTTATNT